MREVRLGKLRVSTRVTFILTDSNDKTIEAAATQLVNALDGQLDRVRLTYSQSVKYLARGLVLTPNCEVSGHLYESTEKANRDLSELVQIVGNLHKLAEVEMCVRREVNTLYERD